MIYRSLSILVFLSILAFSPVAYAADEAHHSDEHKKELSEIKSELTEIKKELKTLKALIQQRPTQKPAAPKRAKANIKDEPVYGARKRPGSSWSNTRTISVRSVQDTQKNTVPLIKKEFVDTGKIRYVLKDFPIRSHKQAKDGADRDALRQ